MKYKNVTEGLKVAVVTNNWWDREPGTVTFCEEHMQGKGTIKVKLDSGKEITLQGAKHLLEWGQYQHQLKTENNRQQRIRDEEKTRSDRRKAAAAKRAQEQAEYEARPEVIEMRLRQEKAAAEYEAEKQAKAVAREKYLSDLNVDLKAIGEQLASRGLADIVVPLATNEIGDYVGHYEGPSTYGETLEQMHQFGVFVVTAEQMKKLLGS